MGKRSPIEAIRRDRQQLGDNVTGTVLSVNKAQGSITMRVIGSLGVTLEDVPLSTSIHITGISAGDQVVATNFGGLWACVGKIQRPVRTSTHEFENVNVSGNVGIGTTGPNAPLEIRKIGAASIQTYLSLRSSLAQSDEGVAISFVMNDTVEVSRINAIGTSNGQELAFWTRNNTGPSLAERVRIDYQGHVGIGTTAPGQILDCNDGSGNMIADGYDSHPSFADRKDDIQAMPFVLDNLVAAKPKMWTRKPFVSADELRKHAIKTHAEAWVKEFGGEIVDGTVTGDDYRGDKLRSIKDPKLLALVDAEADRLRTERKPLAKWQRKQFGLILDDETVVSNIPDVLNINDAGETEGMSVTSYIGMLHGAIVEMATRLDALEQPRLEPK